MKTILLLNQWVRSLFIAAIIGFWAHPTSGRAAISIDNFHLTPNSLTFDISGTLPAMWPGSAQNVLFFSNPSILDNPGFALGEFITTQGVSFSGSQFVERVATGGTEYGDYFYVYFAQDSSGIGRSLLPGETIFGRLTAEWSEAAFDPYVVSTLNVYWGTDWAAGLGNSGVLLTAVQVPEPSALCLLGLGLIIGVRRRGFLRFSTASIPQNGIATLSDLDH